MDKVGIVTLTVANYGNRLQNLAVQMVLEKMGYQPETLHNPFNPDYSETLHKLKNAVKLLIPSKKYRMRVLREKSFENFDKKYIKYSKYWLNNPKHISVLNEKYDYFICGSDQLWNPTSYNYGANNFAMFASDCKKITMAPSFGVTEFPKEREEEFKNYLNTFKKLSVREKSGAEIIFRLTGKNAEVVLDPTLMIDSSVWEKISQKPAWLTDDSYILIYMLGTHYMNDWTKKLAEKYNYKVINLMDKSNLNYFTANPAEFLYLIEHCKAMVTDSFHGSVFSVIFDRPLIVMERKDNFVSMNTRLEHLLELLCISDRKYENLMQKEQIMEHDYSKAWGKIREEQKKSYEFLSKSFKENKVGT